jgi:hypothetical protein
MSDRTARNYPEAPTLQTAYHFLTLQFKRDAGMRGQQKGIHAERRLLSILESHPYPPWMYGVRPATKEEDERGIDIVVTTDVGPIYIQVKSSWNGMSSFFRKRRKAMIAVIVVNDRISDAKIFSEGRKWVRHQRSCILARRQNRRITTSEMP